MDEEKKLRQEEKQIKKFLAAGPSVFDQKLASLKQSEKENQARAKALRILEDATVEEQAPSIVQNEQSLIALDLIDQIYQERNEKVTSGMLHLHDMLKYWAQSNYEPSQPETMVNLAIMDVRRAQEKKDNELTEDDFFTKEEAMNELDRLKLRFNIAIDSDHFNSDQQLFKSFMSMDPRAFFNFKNNADISRTLVKNNFKPSYESGIEKRKREVIRIYEEAKTIKQTLQRLGKELKVMKQFNNGQEYRLAKREYDRTDQAFKTGVKIEQVKEMLAALPETYLPDEQDRLLAQTMRSIQSSTISANNSQAADSRSESRLLKDDSILSLQDATKDFNMASEQNLINVTDFGQDQNAKKKNLRIKKSSPKKGQAPGSMQTSRSRPTPREIKLADMHMKRRIPQLYLCQDIRSNGGSPRKMNEFNLSLQEALMIPKKQRYVTTKHEQESVLRSHRQPKVRKLHNSVVNPKREGEMLPIISVGASANQVEYKDPKMASHPPSQAGDSKPSTATRTRIGGRHNRESEGYDTSRVMPSLSINSPINSGQSLVNKQSTMSTSRNYQDHSTIQSSRSNRGVNPLIRQHLKVANVDINQKIFMTDQQHGESNASLHRLGSDKGRNKVTRSVVSSKISSKPLVVKKDVHERPKNPHLEKVKEIIQQVRDMRGSDPTSSNLKSMGDKVSQQLVTQLLRNEYHIETMDQVQQFADYQPAILKWLFDELQESLEDENETQRNAIIDFERRKLDYKYFQMIENRERSNFNKQINGKKTSD